MSAAFPACDGHKWVKLGTATAAWGPMEGAWLVEAAPAASSACAAQRRRPRLRSRARPACRTRMRPRPPRHHRKGGGDELRLRPRTSSTSISSTAARARSAPARPRRACPVDEYAASRSATATARRWSSATRCLTRGRDRGALSLEMRDLFDDRGEGVSGGRATAQPRNGGARLTSTPAAKKIPADFLRSLGISDYKDNRWPERVMRVPYRDPEGHGPRSSSASPVTTATSSGARGQSRSSAASGEELRGCAVAGGGHPLPPRWSSSRRKRLPHALAPAHPALGLPGASGWRESRDAEHLRDFAQVFVVIEPDQGGQTVLGTKRSSRRSATALLVELDGFKDLNLYLDDPARFRGAGSNQGRRAVARAGRSRRPSAARRRLSVRRWPASLASRRRRTPSRPR